LGVFPEQQYTEHWQGIAWSFSCVGCWTTVVALKVAEELKTDGFRVRVRGRGKRLKQPKNNNPYDDLPL